MLPASTQKDPSHGAASSAPLPASAKRDRLTSERVACSTLAHEAHILKSTLYSDFV
jgi:hypothetical protein